MATCYQKHPFQVNREDRLTTINTKIFEIKKKIQLSEGQRKSYYEENETEKRQNTEKIQSLKKEIKIRLQELAKARSVVGDDQARLRKYVNEVSPVGEKSADQLIHNLDQKVIELRKQLDLLKYGRRKKKFQLKKLEKQYENVLIESNKSKTHGRNNEDLSKKTASHLENDIHRVSIQWNEAMHVKKKYSGIRQALQTDAVRFESSLVEVEDMMREQREEIKKLELVNAEALAMKSRAYAALNEEQGSIADAADKRERELEYFSDRFEERKKELERLEKRIFPQVRAVARPDSAGSGDASAAPEQDRAASEAEQMEKILQKLMRVTGVTAAEQVLQRFLRQRETSVRLQRLKAATEQDKARLERHRATALADLEAFKFAQVEDKEESQEKIEELKTSIAREEEEQDILGVELRSTMDLLMDIKRSIYDFCLKLEVVSYAAFPALPAWAEEDTNVWEELQQLMSALQSRLVTSSSRAADVMLQDGPDDLVVPVIEIPLKHRSPRSPRSCQVTPREEKPPPTDPLPAPTLTLALASYKELSQREVTKPHVSDEEEEIPSRSYLKRQAQLIIDTKSRRKGFRVPYPRK